MRLSLWDASMELILETWYDTDPSSFRYFRRISLDDKARALFSHSFLSSFYVHSIWWIGVSCVRDIKLGLHGPMGALAVEYEHAMHSPTRECGLLQGMWCRILWSRICSRIAIPWLWWLKSSIGAYLAGVTTFLSVTSFLNQLYSSMIRGCIPLASSLSVFFGVARIRSIASCTQPNEKILLFPPNRHQLREFIRNKPKGSTIPADKIQTSIREGPDLQLCLLCCFSSSKKKKNGSWRVYVRCY
jgi:hypothetical protein